MNTEIITEKFTPGPWVSEYDDNGFFYIGANDMPSPYIAATGGEGTADEANAKLIAAAPEMYEAIKNYIAAVDTGEITDQLDTLKAAIKKATD